MSKILDDVRYRVFDYPATQEECRISGSGCETLPHQQDKEQEVEGFRALGLDKVVAIDKYKLRGEEYEGSQSWVRS